MAFTVVEKSSLALPTSIFKNRKLSVLEAITVYLKDKKGLTYAQIARLLNRNDRTVWTSYQRAKKKLAITKKSKISETKK
jgi:DNA-directed RNA polymerase specialized sigma24 family protein